MAYELAKRTADAEQKLATRDGLPARDGALLARACSAATRTASPAALPFPAAKAAMRPFPIRFRRPWLPP